MNLDDLGKTFINSVSMKLSINPSTSVDAAYRAGIRAVVEVLRDEMHNIFMLDPFKVDKVWRDILGDNGEEINQTPVDDSKICEWTDRGHEWVSACKVSFGAFASTKGRFFCPSCDKPIKYNVPV